MLADGLFGHYGSICFEAIIYDANNRLATLRRRQNLSTEPQLASTGFVATNWVFSVTTGQLARKEYADGKGTDI